MTPCRSKQRNPDVGYFVKQLDCQGSPGNLLKQCLTQRKCSIICQLLFLKFCFWTKSCWAPYPHPNFCLSLSYLSYIMQLKGDWVLCAKHCLHTQDKALNKGDFLPHSQRAFFQERDKKHTHTHTHTHEKNRDFLVIQWLRFCIPNAGGPGLIQSRELDPTSRKKDLAQQNK